MESQDPADAIADTPRHEFINPKAGPCITLPKQDIEKYGKEVLYTITDKMFKLYDEEIKKL